MTHKGNAIIIGASGGIGAALYRLISARGDFDRVFPLARSWQDDRHIDLENPASIAAAFDRLGPYLAETRLCLLATGLLHANGRGPEKAIKELDADWMARNFAVNAIGPALVARHFMPLAPRQGVVVFAALGARVGSIGDNRLGGWISYRASKAALAQIIRTTSIEWQRRNADSIAVSLHPGTVETPLSAPFRRGVAPEKLFTPDQSAAHLYRVIRALGPEQSGQALAWDGSPVPA